ncbi:MAG: outer membrane protein assembly factor BamA, partial [Rickettsiales bacterium]|nr:outer membrane protein assembly factor BamA [Rickettsiales bacterium]
MKKFFIIIIFYFPLIFDVLAKDLVVKDIEINGNVRYSEFVYKEFIGIKVGDRFNDGIRNEIIKNLFASDYVNNVRVNFHEGVLIINIEEKIFIKKITFNGNKKLKDDKIKENLKLKVKEMFSQNLLNQDLEFIGNFYKSIGLLNTAVSHELNYLEDNFVEVIFNVKESKKSKIKNIYFIGNKAFKSDTLKTKIFSREKKFYRFLSKTTSYNGDVLDYDAFLLKTFYWTNGYPDFEVISANGKFDSKSNTFDVIFDVEEGQKYYFNKFNIVSNVVGIDTDDLEYLVADVEAGDIFDINVVNKRVQKISNIVSRKNKFINVEPQIIPDKINDRINVNIIIDNAEHIYVGKILIKNNLRTHDSTIRQQLNFEEGSPFSNSDADRSMQKIMNLGFFKNATYTKQKGMFDNQVDITIMVEEKNSGSLNFGVGYSSLNKINGNFGVNQRNLFGRAINLDFNVNVDKYYRSFSFGIIKPSFLGTNMTAGINTFYSENDNR